ncbi:hypothetical protein ACNF40_07345 [Cuniculiplasma sp. SKW4]|uniref:hypothetical protein n=1 Tax=Cuniculiplasma sp. SKW4 TaxID=3400171 RepID=UPI003FD18191
MEVHTEERPRYIYSPNLNSFTQQNSSSEIGNINYTLILYNNSLLSGNIIDAGNGIQPNGATLDKMNNRIYVTNLYSGYVSVVNSETNKISSAIPIGHRQLASVFDCSNENLYVINPKGIYAINITTDKIISNITVGLNPVGAAYDPSNGYIYVVNEGSNNVSVINGTSNKVILSLNVGSNPKNIVYDPNNQNLYVTNFGTNNISVINGSKNYVYSTIEVPNGPDAEVFNPSDNYIYVTTSGNVSVVDVETNKVIYTIQTGNDSDGVAFDPSNGYIYVTNEGSNNVTVINGKTNQVISNITVGSSPVWAVYDPSNGYIFVANLYSFNLSVIDGITDRIISTIYVGTPETGGTFDPSNGYLYVTNFVSGSLSIIFTKESTKYYSVEFNEIGLPDGTAWYVNLSNDMDSGAITGNTFSFSLPNGTYSYTLATENKSYEPSQISGSFKVNGSSVINSVTFSLAIYPVSFTETGLQSLTPWYVNLSNGMHIGPFVGFVNLNLPNGTYTYTVASSNKSYRPLTSSGSFRVEGAPVRVNMVFIRVLYNLTFTESGLPIGTIWYVNLSNGMGSGAIRGDSYSIALTNGTYFYNVSSVSGYKIESATGAVEINGKNQSKTVVYSLISQSQNSPTGIHSEEIYATIAAAVAIASLSLIIIFMRRKR